jgi:hypothetical protein
MRSHAVHFAEDSVNVRESLPGKNDGLPGKWLVGKENAIPPDR